MEELNKLEDYLKEHNIKYNRTDRDKTEKALDFHQIMVYDDDKPIWDAICHTGSYGFEQGLIEVMGSIVSKEAGDKCEGWLTADEIIRRLEA